MSESQRYNPDDFSFAPPALKEAEPVRSFYSDVIAYNRAHPTHEIQWKEYELGRILGLIKKGELFVVKSLDHDAVPTAADVLDQDFAAWEGDLPDRALHFSKFAGAPHMKGIGKQVLWPKTVAYARAAGYWYLVCEAFPVEGLNRFYLSLGMQERGSRTYPSGYYGEIITADRYSYRL